jgi:hypothetical protein
MAAYINSWSEEAVLMTQHSVGIRLSPLENIIVLLYGLDKMNPRC